MSPLSAASGLAKVKLANPRRLRPVLWRQAQAVAARAGVALTRLEDVDRRYQRTSYNEESPLPPGAADTLRQDNPALIELERAYDALHLPATAHTQWQPNSLRSNLTLAWFRGDNAYVWQFRLLRAAAEVRIYLQLLDVEARDDLGLLTRLDEDALFGAWTFTFGQRAPVTRDLLDSVNEINYLDRRIGLAGIEDLRVLDIGAGYGRLAHRMSAALPNLAAYDCIDGVATSTFLCDYYLRFRGAPDTVRVVRLDEHESLGASYDVCVNIHSFSECPYEAIRWWLERVAERDIEWLLIVPNEPRVLLSIEEDGTRKDFLPLVLEAGYELVDNRWTHESDELRELIGVENSFFLFRRSPTS